MVIDLHGMWISSLTLTLLNVTDKNSLVLVLQFGIFNEIAYFEN